MKIKALWPILSIWCYALTISFLDDPNRWLGLVAQAGILAVSLKIRDKRALHLSLACLLIIGLCLIPTTQQWPVPSLMATSFLGIYFMRASAGSIALKRNKLSLKELFISVLVAILSLVGVLLWFHFLSPSLESSPFRLPPLPRFELILFLIGFSAINAFAEEFLFRNLALGSLNESYSPLMSNLIQGSAFGLLHYAGFPFGITGMIMGFVFGLMMGALRQITKGLLSPWLAHFLTDLGIAALFLSMQA